MSHLKPLKLLFPTSVCFKTDLTSLMLRTWATLWDTLIKPIISHPKVNIVPRKKIVLTSGYRLPTARTSLIIRYYMYFTVLFLFLQLTPADEVLEDAPRSPLKSNLVEMLLRSAAALASLFLPPIYHTHNTTALLQPLSSFMTNLSLLKSNITKANKVNW